MSRTEMAYTEVSLTVPDGRRHVVVDCTAEAIDTDPEGSGLMSRWTT
jgi:hypothetical protein